jgi:regulator of protease activity HflC (stomatin/prohibitin superfamily)
MAITTGIGIIAAIFWLGMVGGLVLTALNVSRRRATKPGLILAGIGLAGGLLLTTLNSGLVVIQPNERGVVFRQLGGGATGLRPQPLQPGLNWVLPFVDKVIPYDVGRQTVTMAGSFDAQVSQAAGAASVRARTKDGQEVFIDVTVIYTIDPVKVNQVHQNWQQSYIDGLIVSQARTKTRDAAASFGVEEIYGTSRVEMQQLVFDTLQPIFEDEGFVLVDVLIRDITFSPEYADAVERKQIAEQEAQRARFLVQQQEQEAERARVEAQGLADAVVIRAEGEAEAIRVRAGAEAEALRLINEQISQNPDLIQWRYIDELGDQVQLIVVPSDSPFLFALDQLAAQAARPTPAATPAESPPTGGEQGGTP